MWIEISFNNKNHLLNSNLIESINKYPEKSYLEISFTKGQLILNFDNLEVTNAYYEGFVLALNGLDFVCEATDTLPSGFIKPLLQSKNEALHRHLMLKEVLSDRK